MPEPIELLVIDPQNDFCDLPEAYCPEGPGGQARLRPALPVPGAHGDMLRIAGFIRGAGPHLGGITVTLDSHHRVSIYHPAFWQTGQGQAVAPFTPITAAEVRRGAYRPRKATAEGPALAYLDALESQGRYTLMVWPVHCEIGTWGHNVHADVLAAYNAWEESQLTTVSKILKGDNPMTEHYSALLAEVPVPGDPRTELNRVLLDRLNRAHTLLVCGEAGSHCVKATCEHLVEHLPDQSAGRLARLVLLSDCMSPVAGFAEAQAEFLHDMANRGARVMTSAEAEQLL